MYVYEFFWKRWIKVGTSPMENPTPITYQRWKVEVCNSPVFVRKTFRGYPNLRGGTQHYNIPEKRLHERLHENGQLKTPFIITHHQEKNDHRCRSKMLNYLGLTALTPGSASAKPPTVVANNPTWTNVEKLRNFFSKRKLTNYPPTT